MNIVYHMTMCGSEITPCNIISDKLLVVNIFLGSITCTRAVQI